MTSPNPVRIVLLGNAGAGKSTMAKLLIGDRPIPRLSLDSIAWKEPAVRKPLSESLAELHVFLSTCPEWIIDGCYGDLIEAALPSCTELRFLNPGVEVCISHCLARPWEPEKFPTPAKQNEMLQTLIEWVRQYPTRDDEYGLSRHRKIFGEFRGPKREFQTANR